MNNEGEREYSPEPWDRESQSQDVTVEPDGSADGELAQVDIASGDDPYREDDSEDWQPRHEIGIETRKKKRPLWIVLAIVAVLAALVAGIGYLTTPRASTIKKWAREGNHAKLERFLSTHADWQGEEGKKADTYVLALTEALKLDQNRYESVFLKGFGQAEDWQRAAILGKVTGIEFRPRLLALILETYKTRRYTVIGSPHDGGIEPGSRVAKQFEYLKAAVAKLPVNVADSILVCAAGNGGGDGNLGIVRENIGILYPLDNGTYPTFSRLVRNVGALKELETNEASTLGELDQIEETIQETREELKDKQTAVSNSFVLHFWVVGQHDNGDYEIDLNPYGYGSQRAILKTFSVDYSSRGHASLRVMKLWDEPVRVKEEFGGFSQNWPVYIEDKSYYSNQEETAELRANIDSYEAKRQDLNRSIPEIRAALQRLQGEILDDAQRYHTR